MDQAQQSLHILLIEDDEDDYVITRDLLDDVYGQNYLLNWQRTFENGLEMLRQGGFDLCLVDYRLGERDGLQILNQMSSLRDAHIPVIMLTGQNDRSLDLAAMKAGAADFLVKGHINCDVLERSIRYTLQRAALLKQLRELSTHDELTKLYNRREIVRLLELECRKYDRNFKPFSLVMIDIDKFKQINDEYGHHNGDKALQYLASIITNTARATDLAGRYGGDEFMLILPETDLENAYHLAERLRERVAAGSIESDSGAPIQFTISLGVTEFPMHASTPEELVRVADEAHYSAKKQGRNLTRLM